MTLSFKQFATQFLGRKLRVTVRDAASAAGFVHPPISLRAVISSAAPYVPAHSAIDASNNTDPGQGGGPPIVVFSWLDPANSPASGSTPPNQLRQATWWNLTVKEAGGEIGGPVINETVPFRNETAGVVKFTYTSYQLDGQYFFQVTAFNDYGSASTAETVWITVPGRIPTIKVTDAGGPNADFTIMGSGFTPGGNVKILAWASGNGGWGTIETIAATQDGVISTFTSCKSICSQAGGGQLQFTATDLETNTSATGTGNCP